MSGESNVEKRLLCLTGVIEVDLQHDIHALTRERVASDFRFQDFLRITRRPYAHIESSPVTSDLAACSRFCSLRCVGDDWGPLGTIGDD
jgi:hypothetical protein